MSNELLYQVALPLIPHVGGGTARTLVKHFGSAEAVFAAAPEKLRKTPRIGEVITKSILQSRINALRQAEEVMQRAEKEEVQLLPFTHADYPQRLQHVPDAPLLLYYKGTADLNALKVVSIVGTRKSTDYGRQVTEQIVQGLVQHEVLVVSGLAFGIDILAHKAALKHGLPTVGVMANSVETVYPTAHQRDAENMLRHGGLLSEFPFGTKPDAPRFPSRNRIIAGMADCTIVVESTSKGGSLISADIAHSYDREVMAVPGPITSETSQGCNQLIRSLKAVPYTKPKDLEELLNWDKALAPRSLSKPVQAAPTLSLSSFPEEEQIILRALQQAGPLHIDVLCRHTRFNISQVSSLLFTLEMSGWVKALPGKQYLLV
ncbi:DNA-processing protein DprA [Rufibacter glacialis]|uniref:DNA-processing protein DprA n=1 Tax=Rufibacter glacialis TaxID=1259555 RepID=A0A5M8QH85_9BACT|nr:DNA-processing protein DprA [Rufibacter glacialis]KAA6434290.1 DNA-protecting protein DprA [Rufibacter glacialis]GGK68337.1 DNA processing protein DprA [Rufibacter glacialis]